MFGAAAAYPLSPHFETRRLHVAAHEGPDFIFFEPELKLNGFKRGAVFPGHFNDAGNVAFGKFNCVFHDRVTGGMTLPVHRKLICSS